MDRRRTKRQAPEASGDPPIDPAKLKAEIAELGSYLALASRHSRPTPKASSSYPFLRRARSQSRANGRTAQGRDLHGIRPHPEPTSPDLLAANGYAGEIVADERQQQDAESHAIYADWLARHAGTPCISGSKTADMKAAIVEAFRDHKTDPDRHRIRRRGHQPSVLLAACQFRSAVESATGGAAHRPLSSLRPEDRRAGGQLPQPEEPRRGARVRAPRRQIQAVRGRFRGERRGAWARSKAAPISSAGFSRSISWRAPRPRSTPTSTGFGPNSTPASRPTFWTRAASCLASLIKTLSHPEGS